MKKNIAGSFLTLAVVAMSMSSAFAEGKGPCGPLWDACSAKTPQDHRAVHACMENLKSEKPVDGVSVAKSDVDACKAAHPQHHHKDKTPAANSSGDSSGAAPAPTN